MPFNARIFLFGFLPIVLLAYLAVSGLTKLVDRDGNRFGQVPRNLLLFVASLCFYAWGEGVLVLLMLGSILGNWLTGLWLGREVARAGRGSTGARVALAAGVVLDLGLLAWFKYANFMMGWLEGWQAIALPIGISFYTFQALSYLIDVYRGQAEVQRDPISFGLYIALFPQLIAGPIVRYRDLAQQLAERHLSLELFGSGVRRFVIGLAKKVLIADTVAEAANAIFATPPGELSVALAWAGTAAYSIQIYFDFSGYSDMAIGLGRMFGFRLLENFRWPYISQSITEYWRRWHISLSTWFRDYLYVPLGGNRKGTLRTYFNLIAIFLLCGLWHGAAWTYVVWGAYQGFFLVIERLGLLRMLESAWRPLRHAYMHLVLLFGWVLFRSENLGQAGVYYRSMFGAGTATDAAFREGRYLDSTFWLTMLLGAIGSLPWLPRVREFMRASGGSGARRAFVGGMEAVGALATIALFVLCLSYATAQTQSPFIYFRF